MSDANAPAPPAEPPNRSPAARRWWVIGASVLALGLVAALVVALTGDDGNDAKKRACAYFSEHINEITLATTDRAAYAQHLDQLARESDDAAFRQVGADLVALSEREFEQEEWVDGVLDFSIACTGPPIGPSGDSTP